MKKASLAATVSLILMTTTIARAYDVIDNQLPAVPSPIGPTEPDTAGSVPGSSMPVEVPEPAVVESAPESSIDAREAVAPARVTQPDSAVEINDLSTITTRSVREKESQGARYRVSLQEYAAKGTAYDPLSPFRQERYESQLIYEYFPRPEISVGAIPIFMQATYSYKLLPDTNTVKSSGIVPFASYLFTPEWLGSAQCGYYYDTNNWTYQQFAGGPPTVRLRQRGDRFFGAMYMTWIGPKQPVTGSVRFGAAYVFQHLKPAIDSISDFIPSENFQRGAVSLSGRLKYVPAEGWELYFQTELDYSLKVTRRVTDYRAGGGRQRIRFLAGPGVHYSISPASEVSLGYNSVQGYGFYRENQFTLRFRMLL
jgi:hypothetical protein